jgi:hypothetical protein
MKTNEQFSSRFILLHLAPIFFLLKVPTERKGGEKHFEVGMKVVGLLFLGGGGIIAALLQ